MPRSQSAVALAFVLLVVLPSVLAPAVTAASAVTIDFTHVGDVPSVRVGDSVALEAIAEVRSVGERGGVEVVRFFAQDDAGRFLQVVPSQANLTPASPSVLVRVMYPAQSVGDRVVTLEALGTVSHGEIDLGVVVLKDVAHVAIRDISEPDSHWRVEVAVDTAFERIPSATGRVEILARYSGDAGEFEWIDPAANASGPGLASVPFKLRFGAGTYALVARFTSARAEGTSEEARVTAVDAASADASLAVRATIADAPTGLALTTDSVNAFRAKAPGDAIITRFTVSDANGLDDIRSLRVRYEREGDGGTWRFIMESVIDVGVREWSETAAEFEDRFAYSPLPVGAYRARVIATSRANATFEVSRAFNMTDARPTARLDPFEPAHLGPGHGGHVRTTLSLADRNFGTTEDDAPAPPAFTALEARLYRASTRVPWAVSLGPRVENGSVILDLSDHAAANGTFVYRVEDGAGVLAVPVEVDVPAGAGEGTYRVSVYERDRSGDARLLASANFAVGALPTITRLVAVTPLVRPNEVANVTADVSPGDGVAEVVLRALVGGNEVARATYPAFNATTRANYSVALPNGIPEGALTLSLEVAPVGGGASVVRAVVVDVANVPPRASHSVSLLGRPVPGTVRVIPDATLDIVGQGIDANGDAVTLSLALLDWNGGLVNASLARVEAVAPPSGPPGATAAWRVHLSAALGAGRYSLVTTARDIHGAPNETRSAVDVGAWLEIGLVGPPMELEDVGDVLAGSTTLANVGNVPLRKLHVRFENGDGLFARGDVTLMVGDSAVATGPILDGAARLTLAADALPSGEAATLTVRAFKVPGLDAGVREARMVVVAEAVA